MSEREPYTEWCAYCACRTALGPLRSRKTAQHRSVDQAVTGEGTQSVSLLGQWVGMVGAVPHTHSSADRIACTRTLPLPVTLTNPLPQSRGRVSTKEVSQHLPCQHPTHCEMVHPFPNTTALYVIHQVRDSFQLCVDLVKELFQINDMKSVTVASNPTHQHCVGVWATHQNCVGVWTWDLRARARMRPGASGY